MMAIITALSGGCSLTNNKTLLASVDKNSLSMAIDIDLPGDFVLSGEHYGYQYETAKQFVEQSGIELDVVDDCSLASIRKMLETRQIDMAATLISNADALNGVLSTELCKTTYVLVGRNGRSVVADDGSLSYGNIGSGRILVSEGFTSTRSYDRLLDSLPEAHIYITSASGYKAAEAVSAKQFDWLICEKSEAQLGHELVRNVESVWEFDEPVSIGFVFADKVIKKLFDDWYAHFRGGEEYAMLNFLYFDKGIVGQLTALNKSSKVVNGISVWDELIKRVAQREQVDWRLLSAIAYSESNFRNNLTSHRGAQGLMQVTPVVAREFNMENDDLMNPEVNITLAAKLLKRTEKVLKFAPSANIEDKTSIIIAAYNCGIGRVIQARQVLERQQGKPDSWEQVAETLRRMRDAEFVTDNRVATGIFYESSTTLAYVDRVMNKYDNYCRTLN